MSHILLELSNNNTLIMWISLYLKRKKNH